MRSSGYLEEVHADLREVLEIVRDPAPRGRSRALSKRTRRGPRAPSRSSISLSLCYGEPLAARRGGPRRIEQRVAARARTQTSIVGTVGVTRRPARARSGEFGGAIKIAASLSRRGGGRGAARGRGWSRMGEGRGGPAARAHHLVLSEILPVDADLVPLHRPGRRCLVVRAEEPGWLAPRRQRPSPSSQVLG